MSDPVPFRLEIIPQRGPGPVTLDGVTHPTITSALAAARPGSIVELGRGRYGPDAETFPLQVPTGVTLRGPVPADIPMEARKHLPEPVPAELVGPGPLIEITHREVRLEHLRLHGREPDGNPAIIACDVTDLVVDTCVVAGGIRLQRVRGARIEWTMLEPGRIELEEVTDVRITGGRCTAPSSASSAIEMRRASVVRVEATAVAGNGIGVALAESDDVLVSGCALLTEQTALQATRTRDLRITGNRLRADRAVRLIECRDGSLTANGFERADVAVTLDQCHDIEVAGNHFGDVRVRVEES